MIIDYYKSVAYNDNTIYSSISQNKAAHDEWSQLGITVQTPITSKVLWINLM